MAELHYLWQVTVAGLGTGLIYGIVGTVVVPWGLALGTTPHLFAVYSQLPWRVLLLPPTFAFSWGIASMLATLLLMGVFGLLFVLSRFMKISQAFGARA